MIDHKYYLLLNAEERRDYFEEKAVRDRILELQGEYLHRNQHTGQSSEDLKAIEVACWNEYYKDKKNSNNDEMK